MKILVLTSIYPQCDDDFKAGITPVVKYFVKEWVKDNNEVVVIHNANRYPWIFYMLPDKTIQIINSKAGIVVPRKCQRKFLYSEDNGIKSFRLPITKLIPKGRFFKFQINNQYKKITSILEKQNFIPDVIIGHWENPQAHLISLLKNKYKCNSSLVLHDTGNIDKSWIKNYIYDIDFIGCRSRHMAKVAQEKLNLEKYPFVCYSGIPDGYVNSNKVTSRKKYNSKTVDKYIYVGQLIERKNIDTIIKALNIAYPDKQFILNIIGVGVLEASLKSLAKELELSDNVNFLGRVSREEVINLMMESEIFTMVSKNEAFGLVYLEAMCSGCIVVASKDEGIDGVIINGENGFLCSAGDEIELASIYKKIRNLSIEDKNKLLDNSLKTVNEFTDSNVANKYLKTVATNKEN